jgi:hypothetical protein
MMKKIMIIAALAIFSTGIAQNTNEKEVEKVKKTYVTDSDGVEVQTKKVEVNSNSEIALGKRTSYHNFNTIMKPKKITTDVTYDYDSTTYRFVKTPYGYALVDETDKAMTRANLYPTSQMGYYIYTENGTSSLGYFNADGDFIVETYDVDDDGVISYRYEMNLDDSKKMKKKMK